MNTSQVSGVRHMKQKKQVAVIAILTMLMVSFQNCSNVKFNKKNDSESDNGSLFLNPDLDPTTFDMESISVPEGLPALFFVQVKEDEDAEPRDYEFEWLAPDGSRIKKGDSPFHEIPNVTLEDQGVYRVIITSDGEFVDEVGADLIVVIQEMPEPEPLITRKSLAGGHPNAIICDSSDGTAARVFYMTHNSQAYGVTYTDPYSHGNSNGHEEAASFYLSFNYDGSFKQHFNVIATAQFAGCVNKSLQSLRAEGKTIEPDHSRIALDSFPNAILCKSGSTSSAYYLSSYNASSVTYINPVIAQAAGPRATFDRNTGSSSNSACGGLSIQELVSNSISADRNPSDNFALGHAESSLYDHETMIEKEGIPDIIRCQGPAGSTNQIFYLAYVNEGSEVRYVDHITHRSSGPGAYALSFSYSSGDYIRDFGGANAHYSGCIGKSLDELSESGQTYLFSEIL